MNKSVLAFAVLGAFAGAATAQSPMTLYGRVDLSVGKAAGSPAKYMANGSGSRLGVRGVEDLGGGLQALFQIEHRFEADTGNVGGVASQNIGSPIPPTSRFWHGRSIVGLQGGFGQVVLGRDFTPGHLLVHLLSDVFEHTTVVNSFEGGASGGGNDAIISLGIAPVRNDSSLTYRVTANGFTFGAQIAEATDSLVNVRNNPWNVALSYSAGPLTVGVAFDRNGREAVETAQAMQAMASWNFGRFKVVGGLARGTTQDDVERTGWLLGATAPVGAGEARISFGQREEERPVLLGGGDVKTHQNIAAGYHYSLSKRTTVYTDVVHNRKLPTSKTGYDVGIKHNF